MTTNADKLQFGLRGLSAALDRLNVVSFNDIPLCVSEVLHWAYALDDFFSKRAGSTQYYAEQQDHQHGRVIYGLIHGRNQMTHDLALVGELIGGAFQAGVFQANVFQVGRWHWVEASALGPPSGPYGPEREQHYADYVQERPVAEPLESLHPWFEAAKRRWGP